MNKDPIRNSHDIYIYTIYCFRVLSARTKPLWLNIFKINYKLSVIMEIKLIIILNYIRISNVAYITKYRRVDCVSKTNIISHKSNFKRVQKKLCFISK